MKDLIILISLSCMNIIILLGDSKNYEIEQVLHLIPKNLVRKLVYKKIDISNYHEYAVLDESKCHNINENIQRSWFFNDKDITLQDDDIIIDVDVDEIIYTKSYKELITEFLRYNCPLSIKMNQFF